MRRSLSLLARHSAAYALKGNAALVSLPWLLPAVSPTIDDTSCFINPALIPMKTTPSTITNALPHTRTQRTGRHCAPSVHRYTTQSSSSSSSSSPASAPRGAVSHTAASADELTGLAVMLADADAGRRAPCGRGPMTAYQEGLEEGLLRRDERQEATVRELQRLYDELTEVYPTSTRRRPGSSGLTLVQASPGTNEDGDGKHQRPWWRTLFSSTLTSDDDSRMMLNGAYGKVVPKVRGLYMFGGVGCGKTMLMDLFAACAPNSFKLQRIHFHDFMLDVHAALRRHASSSDPLTLVADDVAHTSHVLCLDEFFVTDVADAMILHRLFARLWDRGLVLVATSNRHPDALYEGGLQRALFLPFIDRLKTSCVVHDMESGTDYRRLAQHREGLYFVGGEGANEAVWKRFIELTNGSEIKEQAVDVAMGRRLTLPRVGGCIAHFTFQELCDRPLGAADYIALANTKHSIALSDIPRFKAANRAAAYRFVTLIDVLYEHRVRLVCSAASSPSDLFANVVTQREAHQGQQGRVSTKGVTKSGSASASSSSSSFLKSSRADGEDVVVDDNLGFSKDRTVSRLTEMQSKEYLHAHAQTHAPELLYALEEADKRGRAAAIGS